MVRSLPDRPNQPHLEGSGVAAILDCADFSPFGVFVHPPLHVAIAKNLNRPERIQADISSRSHSALYQQHRCDHQFLFDGQDRIRAEPVVRVK